MLFIHYTSLHCIHLMCLPAGWPLKSLLVKSTKVQEHFYQCKNAYLMCIPCVISNVYLVHTSCNSFLHFEPIFLVQQNRPGAGFVLLHLLSHLDGSQMATPVCTQFCQRGSSEIHLSSLCMGDASKQRFGSFSAIQGPLCLCCLLLWVGTCWQSNFAATCQPLEGLQHSQVAPHEAGDLPGDPAKAHK